MNVKHFWHQITASLILGLLFASLNFAGANAQELDPSAPDETIKLIFIHHSCGENWLADGNGELGRILGLNNYFVSDTNYGWGPDSIGDATDYYNWYDWFVGPESWRYLAALYAESGQNSDYTRHLSDPGGENRIILFKSCFPNSDLSGRGTDPANPDEWYTVGHAKYIYNQLLDYFITRPDKLFVVITPPPLLDPANALNAREFSRWLVEDWLTENEYPLNNVAVWDFHNILTNANNHHRYLDGRVEYLINIGPGTLYYDSFGDEHPNQRGNQKATEEFVPMLNIFYNRWAATAPETAPIAEQEAPAPTAEEQPDTAQEDSAPADAAQAPRPPIGEGVIDDFEAGSPANTNGWEGFSGDSAQTTISCGVDSSLAHSGTASLRIDFHVEPNDWATCALLYDPAPDFRAATGISLEYRAGAPGLVFDINAHGGTPDARTTFYYTVETVPESVDGWVHLDLTWDQIVGADWEATPGQPVNPAEINGFAFGFSTFSDAPNSGTIWIDNLEMYFSEPASPAEAQPEEEPTAEGISEEPPEELAAPVEDSPGRSICPNSMALMGVVGMVGLIGARRRKFDS